MKAVIVDDNEIERLNLSLLLRNHPEVEIAGEAENVDEAISLIRTTAPELIFLDIHLGDQLGFSALEATSTNASVIITTAHPRYAIKAFEINAVDYLLKPVMEENLARSLRRIPGLLTAQEATRSYHLQMDDIQLFKRRDGLDAVPVSDIILISGERIYTKVHLKGNREYLHNRPLREWVELLPENVFKSLDRSRIVNLREIKGVSDVSAADFDLSFRDSTLTVRIKRTAMKSLKDLY